MTQSSRRHHYVPIWLLKNFCIGKTEQLWVGTKESREVRKSSARKLFSRNHGNTRTNYVGDGNGEFVRVRRAPDEDILADIDNRTSIAGNQLVKWTRTFGESHEFSGPPPPNGMEWCKKLIVAQARRSWESQDRIGLVQGLEERLWDSFYQRADDVGFDLGPRGSLSGHPRAKRLISDIEQNLRANFASGDDPVLKAKEDNFLAWTGLQIAILASSGPGFVIGNQGLTIINGPAGDTSWLPLAPDVAISLTDKPNSCAVGIFTDGFAQGHNKCALAMNKMIASDSKRTIDDLLGKLDC